MLQVNSLRSGHTEPIDMEWKTGGRPISCHDQLEGSFACCPSLAFRISGSWLLTIVPALAEHCATVKPITNAFPGWHGPLAIDTLRNKSIRGLNTTPLLPGRIAERDSGLDTLGKVKDLTYTGGPLCQGLVDELLTQGLHLLQQTVSLPQEVCKLGMDPIPGRSAYRLARPWER